MVKKVAPLMTRFMGSAWGPPGTDRTPAGLTLAPWASWHFEDIAWESKPCVPQEISLSTIEAIRKPQWTKPPAGGPNPHVFELETPSAVYYVGEDPRSTSDVEPLSSAESGVGLAQALCWESSLRQALMPVTHHGTGSGTGRQRFHHRYRIRQNAKPWGKSQISIRLIGVEAMVFAIWVPFY